jgi:FkbM family methyltransferase
VLADPTKSIGHSIRTTGLYDLVVSEVLARLIDPGNTVIDAGANVGYMSLLASVAAGPSGRVISFEPHPELFATLQRNVAASAGRFRIAPIELHNAALGDRGGTAELVIPTDFGTNDGVGWITSAPAAGVRSITVPLETLDHALGEASARLLKLDVEGFELHVLRGAMRALESRRIHHVVFEDHDVARSEVVRLLQTLGYRVFSVGWTLSGLALSPVETGTLATAYEAPSFIASIEPDTVMNRCTRGGWLVLRNRAKRG